MDYIRRLQLFQSDSKGQDETPQTDSSDSPLTSALNQAKSIPEDDTSTQNVDSSDEQTSLHENPIISDEDEQFWQRVVQDDEEGMPPPLPPRPVSAYSSLKNLLDSKQPDEAVAKSKSPWKSTWENYRLSQSRITAADDLMSAADGLKALSEVSDDDIPEEAQEKRDVNWTLKQLNLSSVNNRVVGLSHDTQKLFQNFNRILKDVLNGVPTAYNDLEVLIAENQTRLDKLYNGLPWFLKKFITALPVQAYAAAAPQLAATYLSNKDGKTRDKKSQSGPPSLTQLFRDRKAIESMLRSTVAFVQTRFPSIVLGTNVVMSLAVCILFFVLGYCYKRGHEERLAGEGAEATTKTAEAQAPDINLQNEAPTDNSDDITREVEKMAMEIENKP